MLRKTLETLEKLKRSVKEVMKKSAQFILEDFRVTNWLLKENEVLLQNVSNLQRELLEKEQLLEQQQEEYNEQRFDAC